jgi:ATP-dependent RNA helicase RhlE
MYMVNYDISNEPETYVHRIGRTWRAWKDWIAYSFCNQEEVEYLLDVQKMLWKKISVIIDHPFHIEVDESIKAPKKQQWRGRRQFSSKRPSNDNGKRNVRRKKNKR